jgi:hypothetical protein
MRLSKAAYLILFTAFMSAQTSWAGVCDSSTTKEQQMANYDYYSQHGTCAPGTGGKYTTVAANLPCFQMDYLDKDDAGRVRPEVCYPDKNKCESMLNTGESFKISDLQKQAHAPDDDSDSLKGRLMTLLRLGAKVGQKVATYGAIAIPVGGDGVTAFLGDMGDKMDDMKNDKDKATAAAKQMSALFSYLLGSAPTTIPGVTTSCNDFKKASYHDGKGVAQGLQDLFINLSQDKNIDMGNKSDDAQLTAGDIALFKLKAQVRDARTKDVIDPTPQTAGGTISTEQLAPFAFNQSVIKNTGPEASGNAGPDSSNTSGATQ